MMVTPRRKPRREAVPPDASLCDYCSAKCCKYFALPIDKPRDRQDFDFMRWFLLHEGATVFTEDGDWYLLVYATCKHLQSDNRCGIYTTRPQICRDYSTVDCEFEDDWVYDQYFENAEQVAEFMEAVLPPEYAGEIRSPRPPLLPVLS